MGYYEENKKLYPLKAGDVLECVEAEGPFFKKGNFYAANPVGQVISEWGSPWWNDSFDVPSGYKFKLKSSTPEWTEGQPPEELPEGKQAVIGYKLVDKPVLEVGKVYTDGLGCKWKALCEANGGILLMLENNLSALLWSFEGKPKWTDSERYTIDFSVPPQDDY